MKPHTIELDIEGGVVHDVRYIPYNTIVRILDSDIEGVEEERITWLNGKATVVSEHHSDNLLELYSTVPEGWTKEQLKSAIGVCERQDVAFKPADWLPYDGGDYIGQKFRKTNIFIGIEKDGYAHS